MIIISLAIRVDTTFENKYQIYGRMRLYMVIFQGKTSTHTMVIVQVWYWCIHILMVPTDRLEPTQDVQFMRSCVNPRISLLKQSRGRRSNIAEGLGYLLTKASTKASWKRQVLMVGAIFVTFKAFLLTFLEVGLRMVTPEPWNGFLFFIRSWHVVEHLGRCDQ